MNNITGQMAMFSDIVTFYIQKDESELFITLKVPFSGTLGSIKLNIKLWMSENVFHINADKREDCLFWPTGFYLLAYRQVRMSVWVLSALMLRIVETSSQQETKTRNTIEVRSCLSFFLIWRKLSMLSSYHVLIIAMLFIPV